jgi:hypothetical protein
MLAKRLSQPNASTSRRLSASLLLVQMASRAPRAASASIAASTSG